MGGEAGKILLDLLSAVFIQNEVLSEHPVGAYPSVPVRGETPAKRHPMLSSGRARGRARSPFNFSHPIIVTLLAIDQV